MATSFPHNVYTTGGVVAPTNHEEDKGTPLQMAAACDGTTVNNPNVDPVNPGAHNASGANGSAK